LQAERGGADQNIRGRNKEGGCLRRQPLQVNILPLLKGHRAVYISVQGNNINGVKTREKMEDGGEKEDLPGSIQRTVFR